MINFKLPDNIMVEYDPEAHAAYIRVKEGKVAKTKEEARFITLDLDSRGNLIGIEVINPKQISIQGRRALNHVADEFDLPALKKIRPEAIPQVYAYA
jgi:uncharacterized protein YuzE